MLQFSSTCVFLDQSFYGHVVMALFWCSSILESICSSLLLCLSYYRLEIQKRLCEYFCLQFYYSFEYSVHFFVLYGFAYPVTQAHDNNWNVIGIKVAHTRLPRIGFRSWSRFLAVSLQQVTWVINPALGCHYLTPGLQLPPQPLRGLLPILLLSDRCEQFA